MRRCYGSLVGFLYSRAYHDASRYIYMTYSGFVTRKQEATPIGLVTDK